MPTGEQVFTDASVLADAAQVIDPFAAGNPGTMALNVSASVGALSMTDTRGTLLPGSGTTAISFHGPFAQVNAALATLTYTAGHATGSDNIVINVWDQAGLSATRSVPITIKLAPPPPPGPHLTLPASETVATNASVAVAGIQVSDSFAETNPGTMALRLSDSSGTLTMRDAAGKLLPGSGTSAISFNGTFAEVNTALATLSYTAGATPGIDGIQISIWDQAGLSSNGSIPVTISPPATLEPDAMAPITAASLQTPTAPTLMPSGADIGTVVPTAADMTSPSAPLAPPPDPVPGLQAPLASWTDSPVQPVVVPIPHWS